MAGFGLPNFGQLTEAFKKAKQIQQDAQKLQDELETMEIEGKSDDEMIKVWISGNQLPLKVEVQENILNADWITIGIMAPSDNKAIEALQTISKKYSSIKFNNLDSLHADGSVFLKGNQKTGNVFVRSENGLGEGILITCQYDEGAKESNTFGPLPLDFFT